jgi:hypothetical protein
MPSSDTDDFPKELCESARSATVRVINTASGREGSGVIVRRSGPLVYILSADHVVKDGKAFEVHTFSPASYPKPAATHKAEVIARTNGAITDLAVLRLSTADAVPGTVLVCPLDKLPSENAFPALTSGCSNGKAPTCHIDRVQGKKLVRRAGTLGAAHFWEVGGKPTAGRSGGMLMNKQGYLVGICSGISGEAGYYCHIEDIHRFLKSNALSWLYEESP